MCNVSMGHTIPEFQRFVEMAEQKCDKKKTMPFPTEQSYVYANCIPLRGSGCSVPTIVTHLCLARLSSLIQKKFQKELKQCTMNAWKKKKEKSMQGERVGRNVGRIFVSVLRVVAV